nr:MAG TPA: hypothetical protein [Caudoviricetes sp.]
MNTNEPLIVVKDERAEKLSNYLASTYYPDIIPMRCKDGKFSLYLGGEFSRHSDAVYRTIELSSDGNALIETVELVRLINHKQIPNIDSRKPIYTTIYPYKGNKEDSDSSYWDLPKAPDDILDKFQEITETGKVPTLTVISEIGVPDVERITYSTPVPGYVIEDTIQIYQFPIMEETDHVIHLPKKVYRTE